MPEKPDKKYVFVVTKTTSYMDEYTNDVIQVYGVFDDNLTAYDLASKAFRKEYEFDCRCNGAEEVLIIGDFQITVFDYKTVWFSIERFELNEMKDIMLL